MLNGPCLSCTLALAYVAAAAQAVLAFVPRFSALTLVNALLLATAFVPLATNKRTLGTRIGGWLWVGNLVCFALLFARSATYNFDRKTALPASVSLCGLLAFGCHVVIFMAVP